MLDLDTWAIVGTDGQPGDDHDSADRTDKALRAAVRLKHIGEAVKNLKRQKLIAAQNGYSGLKQLYLPNGVVINIAISDAHQKRRAGRLGGKNRGDVETEEALMTSYAGRGWKLRRSDLLERGAQDVSDCGESACTTLLSRYNRWRLYLTEAVCAKLFLPEAHLAGLGTPGKP